MSQKNNNSLTQDLAELDELMAWFEQDDFELEQAIAKFETANKLADSIRQRLTELENKITVLKENFEDK